MSKEVTLVFMAELEQTDEEWTTWFEAILDDYLGVGNVIEVTQEAV